MVMNHEESMSKLAHECQESIRAKRAHELEKLKLQLEIAKLEASRSENNRQRQHELEMAKLEDSEKNRQHELAMQQRLPSGASRDDEGHVGSREPQTFEEALVIRNQDGRRPEPSLFHRRRNRRT